MKDQIKIALLGAVNLYCIFLAVPLLLDDITGGTKGHGDIIGSIIIAFFWLLIRPLSIAVISILGAILALLIRKEIDHTTWKFAGMKLTIFSFVMVLLLTGINCIEQGTVIPSEIKIYFYRRIDSSTNVNELLSLYHEHKSQFKVATLNRMTDLLFAYYNHGSFADDISFMHANQMRQALLKALYNDDEYVRRTAFEKCTYFLHFQFSEKMFEPKEIKLIYRASLRSLDDDLLMRNTAYKEIPIQLKSENGKKYYYKNDEMRIRKAFLNELKNPNTDSYEIALMNIGKLLNEEDASAPLFYRDALLKVWNYHMKGKYYCGSSLILSILTAMNYRPSDFQEVTPKVIEMLANKECQEPDENRIRTEAIKFLIAINTPEANTALQKQLQHEKLPLNRELIEKKGNL